jgi:hypothetical protein
MQRSRIQSLLAAEASPLRDDLLRMGFDALVAQPLSTLVGHPDLANLILGGLSLENATRITEHHVLPAVARVQERLAKTTDTVGDLLPAEATATLRTLVASGRGPRFAWLKGAIDPADLQKLIGPIVQQVLTSFVSKMTSGSSKSRDDDDGDEERPRGGRGLGGLVGKIGKQVSKGASQLAGGLGLQQLVRDASESAAVEVRVAIVERLRSDEGREILKRIRARVLDRVLAARTTVVVDDFLRLPPQEVGRIGQGAVAHVKDHGFFRDILAGEIQAVLTELGARSLHDVLAEMGQLEAFRKVATGAVEPGLVALIKTDGFGDWLDRVLAQSATPVGE